MKQEILEHLELTNNTLEKIKYIFEHENPFAQPVEAPKYELMKDDRVLLSEFSLAVQPFLTQLTHANNRIEQLIVEKVELACELKILQIREKELENALDFSYHQLLEKDELIADKEDIIANQEHEIELLFKKANKKWWKFWED